jgi:hypothetical protein
MLGSMSLAIKRAFGNPKVVSSSSYFASSLTSSTLASSFTSSALASSLFSSRAGCGCGTTSGSAKAEISSYCDSGCDSD